MATKGLAGINSWQLPQIPSESLGLEGLVLPVATRAHGFRVSLKDGEERSVAKIQPGFKAKAGRWGLG